MSVGGTLGILFVTLLRRVMVEDPDLRAQIGDRARKRVLSAYSLAAVLPQYLHLLRDLAAPEKL